MATCSTSTVRGSTWRSLPSDTPLGLKHSTVRGATHLQVGGAVPQRGSSPTSRRTANARTAPDNRQRAHNRVPVCADRARVFDGVRDPQATQLRARRPVHGRRLHRVLRDPVVRRSERTVDSGAAAARDHDPARRRLGRRARDGDRALCIPPAARRAADRPADHRPGRLVRAREHGPAAVRRLYAQLLDADLHLLQQRDHRRRRADRLGSADDPQASASR